MGNDFKKAVGKRLYSARKAKGYSRAKVGELVGLHETTVKRYEDGDIKSAIVRAINRFNAEDANTYLTLMKATLCDALGLNSAKEEEDLLLRRVEALNKKMLEIVNESVENGTCACCDSAGCHADYDTDSVACTLTVCHCCLSLITDGKQLFK